MYQKFKNVFHFVFVQNLNDIFCWECHGVKHIIWSCSTCVRSFHESAEYLKFRQSEMMQLWQCNECIAIEKDLQRSMAK